MTYLQSGIENCTNRVELQGFVILQNCRKTMLEHSVAATFADIEYLVISRIYQSIDIIPEFLNDFLTELSHITQY